ncbi:cytochrome P450 [Flagelloscypha sp. PMI_526]|nr:cytochrome P450 [Flagelloscypha sp. PMI_526]
MLHLTFIQSLTTSDVCFLTIVLILVLVIYCTRSRHILPPGPQGLPLIGNLFDMPTHDEWVTFAQWGDICSVTILGQTLILLNSYDAATELLEKRSMYNSDRPEPVFAGDLIGWKNTLVLLPYSQRFRRFRKFFNTSIGTASAMRKFHPAKEGETRKFLRRVLAKPQDLRDHIKYSLGASLMRDTYGYLAKESNDPYIDVADTATDQFSAATQAPGYLVDYVPFLRHIPEWFPGAHFKREATEWASTLSNMVERPFAYVKQQVDSGYAPVSFTSELMSDKSLTPSEEYDLKWASASLYSGTTTSAVHSFFLAMALFPEVAKKAQAEIDSIVGIERLPTFSDRPNLPYVNALVTEVFRWHSIVPLCVPHRSSQDDAFRGHFIPKGSLIIANIWGMNHDEAVHKDPMVFSPERYLPSEERAVEPEPRKKTFGFGRRSCPGAQLADANVYITAVSSLAVFEISNVIENGRPIPLVHGNTPGTISHPVPFKCAIRPRSPQAVSLIQSDEPMLQVRPDPQELAADLLVEEANTKGHCLRFVL